MQCYICLEESNLFNKFITYECKCKTYNIHWKCFKKLSDKKNCCICKSRYNIPDKNPMKLIKKELEDGMIEIYTINRKGKKSGYYSCLYPNLNTACRCYFQNGIFDGEFFVYSIEGDILEYRFYTKGVLITQKHIQNFSRRDIENIYIILYVILFCFIFQFPIYFNFNIIAIVYLFLSYIRVIL